MPLQSFYSRILHVKKKKLFLIIISSIIVSLSLAVAIPFIVLGINTSKIKTDYTYLKEDENYQDKVEINGLKLVTQHVSCGYATIEMMSTYYGDKVSEDDLDGRNSAISTSSSKGFLKEIKRSIPTKNFVMSSYLRNDELLKSIYDTIEHGNPVAIEWAAEYEGEWTLHFSLVSALDIKNDNVTVYNPYGYIENIHLDEFLSRTSFEAYSNIPLFLNFGFAYGAFHKNTVFYSPQTLVDYLGL